MSRRILKLMDRITSTGNQKSLIDVLAGSTDKSPVRAPRGHRRSRFLPGEEEVVKINYALFDGTANHDLAAELGVEM